MSIEGLFTSFLAVGPGQVPERPCGPGGASREVPASAWRRHQPPIYHAGSVVFGEI